MEPGHDREESGEMNYIAELNAFHDYLQANQLSTSRDCVMAYFDAHKQQYYVEERVCSGQSDVAAVDGTFHIRPGRSENKLKQEG